MYVCVCAVLCQRAMGSKGMSGKHFHINSLHLPLFCTIPNQPFQRVLYFYIALFFQSPSLSIVPVVVRDARRRLIVVVSVSYLAPALFRRTMGQIFPRCPVPHRSRVKQIELADVVFSVAWVR